MATSTEGSSRKSAHASHRSSCSSGSMAFFASGLLRVRWAIRSRFSYRSLGMDRPYSPRTRPSRRAASQRLRLRTGIGCRSVDFQPSDRVAELLERVREFMDEHVYPVEEEAHRGLDEEVRPGVPYPQVLVDLRERARSEGLEPVSSRRALRPRPHQLGVRDALRADGPQPGG